MQWREILTKAVVAGVRAAVSAPRTRSRASGRRSGARAAGARTSGSGRAPRSGGQREASASQPGSGDYPGDFTGVAEIEYHPKADGRADPGEVVWAWVPFEEDYSQGKDRPALVIGSDDGWLLGLMLTSKDHDSDARQEAAAGRHWLDIGRGDWDPQGRASEVRVDRILRLDPDQVRREGGKLSRDQFDQVAVEVRRVNRW